MDATLLLIYFLSSVFLGAAVRHQPKVYEESNEDLVESESRQPKAPLNPFLAFNYYTTVQRDLRRWRYYQQQKADLSNLIKRNPSTQINSSIVKHTKPKLSTENKRQNSYEENFGIPPLLVKLKPEKFSQKYYGAVLNVGNDITSQRRVIQDETDENENQNQRRIIQEGTIGNVDQKKECNKTDIIRAAKVRRNVDSQQQNIEIESLNTLLGKNPRNQLQSLQKFLYESQSYATPLATQNSFAPIQEDILDTPPPKINPIVVLTYSPGQQVPNEEAPYEPLASIRQQPFEPLASTRQQLLELQAQLDSLAKAQAEDEFKKAQKEAVQKVMVQHSSIALAQKEAKNIMEKINSHTFQFVPQTNGESVRDDASPFSDESVNNQNLQEIDALVSIRESTTTFPIPHGSSYVKDTLPDNKNEEVIEAEDDTGKYIANYAFGYRVKDYDSENDFGHEENNDGRAVQGHYHVQLPDGRTQYVEYTADSSGFHAKVSYRENR